MKTSEMPHCNSATVQIVLPSFSPDSGGLSSGFVGMLPVRSSVVAGSSCCRLGMAHLPCSVTHRLCAVQERSAGGCAEPQGGTPGTLTVFSDHYLWCLTNGCPSSQHIDRDVFFSQEVPVVTSAGGYLVQLVQDFLG